jgi:hypothetical protein
MLFHERSYFSQAEVARIAGFSRQFIANEIKRGNLVAVRRGRKTIISRTHLESWLSTKPSAEAAAADLAATATHGEPPAPATDTARIAAALETIATELAGIRAMMERGR